ncbi:MAG: T9SS type A sorting domain-containing protein [Sphingobacteriaceae bacterium]|jgi:hypothetical protein
MKRICLFIFSIIFITNKITAQVAAYVFSQTNTTYTSLNVPGSTVVASGYQDDNVYSNLPIGFSFTFNNSTYTSVAVSTNGWMTLGAYFPNDNFAPISNSGGNGDAISFLSGDMMLGPYQTCTVTNGSNVINFAYPGASNFFNVGDLIVGTGIPASTSVSAVGFGNVTITANATASGTSITSPGVISYLTTGITPNRVFTMQWKRLARYSNDGTGQDDFTNAQIKLYETSNVVEIVYGRCGTYNPFTMTTEIGLVGMNNLDFNNRSIPLSANWSTSTQGLANNATAVFSNSNTVPNGLTFRWTPPSPCSGTPAANSAIAGSSLACIGGNVNLNLSQTYTNSGLSYLWSAATTSTGPFNPINTSTTSAYTATNILTNTWFICTVTCTNSAGSTTTAPIAITAVASITNTTPYFEGFESVQVNNMLPNCAWSASSPTTICQTYTLQTTFNRKPNTGNKFAAFHFGTNSNGDHFYTNGIQLYSGITYSAAVNYITDGANGWSQFALLYGTSQSTAGLTNIASVTGSITNTTYSVLSNTFTVPANGIYYIAVKAIGNTSPWYLSWDDLSVTAPCNLNTPTLSVNGGTNVLCGGSNINLSVSGASSYTWSSGPVSSSVVVSPLVNTTYSVSGSNMVGCVGLATKQITVDPLPSLTVTPATQTICVTEVATIQVSGANSFTWNPSNSNASTFTLSPSTNLQFTVSGTGANNCVGNATAQVIVSLCTGMNEDFSYDHSVQLIPNPNNGLFKVRSEDMIQTIRITDMNGRSIKQVIVKQNEIALNISELSSGVYFIEVNTSKTRSIKKLIRN